MHQTDEPIEQPTDETNPDEADTEGHSMLNAEMGLGMARDRAREDAKYAVDQARRHEASASKPKRSLRDRLTGR